MMANRIIDDALSARDGQLFIEDCNANDIARAYGTPLFVFFPEQLDRFDGYIPIDCYGVMDRSGCGYKPADTPDAVRQALVVVHNIICPVVFF